ncbi:ABC transporter permease [Niallia sp. 03091]|uniref:ABC transporter permease n=1 Tax=unclassified Niallia TaxID=2837522 RepID=UPI004043A8BA
MYVIGKREFFSLFKGIKSIIILIILLATSYYSAKFANLIKSGIELPASEAEDIHTVGLMFLILIFGQLFVMSLSHDSMNREIHERTVRFLVTRTSRTSIVMGKFLGIWIFWFVCVLTSFLIISIFAKKFDVFLFLQTMSLLAYQIAFAILLSVLISKPGITMFLGIVVGLVFPILGFWITLTSNVYVSWIKYITPFYYLDLNNYTFLVVLIFSGILLIIANQIFKRREC